MVIVGIEMGEIEVGIGELSWCFEQDRLNCTSHSWALFEVEFDSFPNPWQNKQKNEIQNKHDYPLEIEIHLLDFWLKRKKFRRKSG